MENLVTAIGSFFIFEHVIGLLIGLIIGVIIGAIPGLGPTVVIALLMPLLIQFSNILALIIMIGVYVGGIYGGSLSAIWINTPGTPASAVTALEGYKLRQKGFPVKALQSALWASIFGHYFASIILYVACEPLARASLKFQSPEQFALILCALTVISVLSAEEKKKGIAAAALGFIISLIGTDPITGYMRLTFGSHNLRDGIDLFALLIGIFAVAEVIKQMQVLFRQRIEDTKIDYRPNPDDRLSLRYFFGKWKVLLGSSLIGTGIGALPGIGPTTAAFVSYGFAKKNSTEPEKYGKGSEEGIIASEAANNAVCSGALIPMLSLGIPGDATTAVLLGAMVLFGIAPGPMLFINHGALVRTLYVAIFACGLLLLLLGPSIIKLSVSVAYIKPMILWPCISVLCILGVYSINSSIFDVFVMLVFGVLGYVMERFGFHASPLMIAFILANQMEISLRRALLLTNNNVSILFMRPIFSILVIIAILMLVVPVMLEKRRKLLKNKRV